jgi:uncharacterized protein with HEPN domain
MNQNFKIKICLNMIFKELMDIRNYLIHAYFGDFLAFTLVEKPVFCFWEEFQSCA